MTYQELAAEIVRLPIHERLALLELVSRSLRDDLRSDAPRKPLAARLKGIARPDEPAPADGELEDEYTTYLEQKYS
ncbi:MAG TPA: hypothetical protein VLA19_11420 [Herpetosiphonaceae bacterium]|nr:hypothetical protein [Herpetosiphonaceae bacterium]